VIVIEKIPELKNHIQDIKADQKTIGFVPTMGALHKGHKALLERAREENDCVVCSIFVNPIQFNNASDLQNYPRNHEKDISFIQDICDLVFIPSVEEMYPEPPKETYCFGTLEKVMEGAFRDGHFNAVAVVVKRLLDYVQPDTAYFGEKDYQQWLIIVDLVNQLEIPVKIQSVETVRERDGLAISSRNQLLNVEERSIAPHIRKILLQAQVLKGTLTPRQLEENIFNQLSSVACFTPEYVSVADAHTLQPIADYQQTNRVIVCTAVWLNHVRLIDNILI
jgi:pantoate--beta-alanine ligase